MFLDFGWVVWSVLAWRYQATKHCGFPTSNMPGLFHGPRTILFSCPCSKSWGIQTEQKKVATLYLFIIFNNNHSSKSLFFSQWLSDFFTECRHIHHRATGISGSPQHTSKPVFSNNNDLSPFFLHIKWGGSFLPLPSSHFHVWRHGNCDTFCLWHAKYNASSCLLLQAQSKARTLWSEILLT